MKTAILILGAVALVSASPILEARDFEAEWDKAGECQPSIGWVCKQGYRCHLTPGSPPGSKGMCWRNGVCQGSIGLGCLDGYTCVYKPGSPPGAKGKCVKNW